MKKTAIYLIITILAIFLIILAVTSALGEAFGDRAEIIALVFVAVVLFVLLIVNKKS